MCGRTQTHTHTFNVTAPTAISYKKFLIFRLIIFSESLLCAAAEKERERTQKILFLLLFWDRKHSWNIFVRRSLFCYFRSFFLCMFYETNKTLVFCDFWAFSFNFFYLRGCGKIDTNEQKNCLNIHGRFPSSIVLEFLVQKKEYSA